MEDLFRDVYKFRRANGKVDATTPRLAVYNSRTFG